MNKIILCTTILLSAISHGKYYDTLPRGVHMFIYRNIQTSEISSTFDDKKQNSPLSFDLEADSAFLSEIDSSEILADLESISKEAYDNINLGKYHVNIQADVQANVLGMGYGLTNKLSVYVGVPLFEAKVRMNYKRLKKNNFDEIQNILEQDKSDDIAQSTASAIDGLTDFDIHSIQSVFVNTLGYEPLGDWEGNGLGDIETGIIYQLFNERKWGAALSAGVVFPTGYVDNPDILQDFGFGDGQYDQFLEFGFGYSVSPEIQIDHFARFTYQYGSEKELRVPYSQQASTISDTKAIFYEKLGNKIDYTALVEWSINDWLTIAPTYIINYQGKAEYSSPFTEANGFLRHNSDKLAHNAKVTATFTTVEPFLKKKFFMPFQLKFHYQKLITGRNIPASDRLELEFRMMF